MKLSFFNIYAIILSTALVLVLLFFLVFYDIMDNYELSQPNSGIEAYIASLTEDELDLWSEQALDGVELPYDDKDAVLRALRDTVTTDGVSYTKDYTAYTAAEPVYLLSSGDIALCRVTLSAGEELRYGFRGWDTVKVEPLLSLSALSEKTTSVFVPKGAVLLLNGKEVAEAPTETAVYRYQSKWDGTNASESDCYQIRHYFDGAFTCTLDGIPCEERREADGVYFLYPAESLLSCTIEVPHGAAVTVNGVALTDAEITERDIPYEASPAEAMLGNLPTAVVYTLDGLSAMPQVSAVFAGHELLITNEDTSFKAAYPEEMKISCTIRVPVGSSVTIRGVPCPAESATHGETEHTELFSYSGGVPLFDVYELHGLYFAPEEVEITDGGTVIPFTMTRDGNAYAIHGEYPRIDAPESRTLALDFIKTYFVYTSNGYWNTNANLMNVLAYIPYGIELYWKMVQSENGFTWTTPVASMEYNLLEVTDVFSYPGDLRLCKVEFDITQTFNGGIVREYKGDILLLLTAGGAVVGMEIDAQ